ncbi:MAG: aldehyde ferredoxin oxidoreductase [Thermoplasmata archaeon HGW-Thermoplasmata-1]|nr:MAG: aldehyde ferredoxin oxidoreductase [Thermoplasmata archaeon HGW-Thermoplasmata-1]
MYGVNGKILTVDLSSKTIVEGAVAEETYRNFLGGYALGAKYILDNTRPGYDPLGEEAILGFTTGLFTGTGIPFSGRYMVCGKSPLTGGWGDANSGGAFGGALKSSGYDAVFVKGISEKPVYLSIIDGVAELLDAADVWGKDAIETEEALAEKHGKVEVACIGTSSEKLSLISGIVNNRGRIAARSGLGAVMGSKRLKAVVVRGNAKVEVKDRKELNRLTADYLKPFKKKSPAVMKFFLRHIRPVVPLMRMFGMGMDAGPRSGTITVYKDYGTCFATVVSAETGDSPVKNWDGIGYLDFPPSRSDRISDEAVIKYQKKKYFCKYCPVGCGGIFEVGDGKYPLKETHKPEYETLCAFGTLCLNDDLETIMKINDLCNRYGLDTISTGGVCAFAIECYGRGLISKEQAGGLELRWGDGDAIVRLVGMIGQRKGMGDLLADGVKQASVRIAGSGEFAVHAGGQELPMHDSRYDPTLGLAYSCDPTPGRHTQFSEGMAKLSGLRELFPGEKIPKSKKYDYDKKGMVAALHAKYMQVLNACGMCFFSPLMNPPPFVEYINAITGWGFDHARLMETGERIQTMRQMFNIREGIDVANVEMAGRALGRPKLDKGPNKGVTIDLERMRKDYFEEMGWDEKGHPKKERLKIK